MGSEDFDRKNNGVCLWRFGNDQAFPGRNPCAPVGRRLRNSKKDVFRLTPRPAAPVPFGVLSVGHYRLTHPFVCYIRVIDFVQFFWCIAGSGSIEIDGVLRRLKPGQVAVYFPGMLHKWRTDQGQWEFRWMALDGPLVVPLMTAYGLTPNIYQAGACPAGLFRKLEKAVRDPSKKGGLTACLLAQKIITQAVIPAYPRQNLLAAQMLDAISHNWNKSGFNINSMAAILRMHRSSLSRRFHQIMGLPPNAFIQHYRLQNALLLLSNTKYPVVEVAARCGFSDAAYLCRLVRRLTGKVPLQFRRDAGKTQSQKSK